MALDSVLETVPDEVLVLQVRGRRVLEGKLSIYFDPVRARATESYIRRAAQASLGLGSNNPSLEGTPAATLVSSPTTQPAQLARTEFSAFLQ